MKEPMNLAILLEQMASGVEGAMCLGPDPNAEILRDSAYTIRDLSRELEGAQDEAAQGRELLQQIRSWLWLPHPTSRQWEQSSGFYAKAITSRLGDR